jgi:hypothetical protein
MLESEFQEMASALMPQFSAELQSELVKGLSRIVEGWIREEQHRRSEYLTTELAKLHTTMLASKNKEEGTAAA